MLQSLHHDRNWFQWSSGLHSDMVTSGDQLHVTIISSKRHMNNMNYIERHELHPFDGRKVNHHSLQQPAEQTIVPKEVKRSDVIQVSNKLLSTINYLTYTSFN